jgi:hypothetical protein
VRDTPAGPIFPVVFDEPAIAEDLAHHPPVARHALELLRRELDRDEASSPLGSNAAKTKDATAPSCPTA